MVNNAYTWIESKIVSSDFLFFSFDKMYTKVNDFYGKELLKFDFFNYQGTEIH